jgi:hypothetical protein
MTKKVIPSSKKPKVEKKKQVERLDEKLMSEGKYEVRKEDEFSVKFGLNKKNSRWVLVNPETAKEEDRHEVVFRMWKFDEEIELRKKATSYDSSKRMYTIDQDILNRMKVQLLMKSWTFDRDNPRLKLLHQYGVLTDEGWEAFKLLQVNITRYILDKMNEVLEYNG